MKNLKKISNLLLDTGAWVALLDKSERLSRATALMEKYQDVPMDFADATLVCLAEETGIGDVFTLDVRGFSAYRFRGKNPFFGNPS